MADVEQRSVSQDSMIIRVRNEVLPRYAPLGLHTQVGPASEFGGSWQFQPIEYVIGGPASAPAPPPAPRPGHAPPANPPGAWPFSSPDLGRSPHHSRHLSAT